MMIKKTLRLFFVVFESVFAFFNNWHHIPGSKDILVVSFHTYKGETLTLADHTVIQQGDRVGEIHINNTKAIDLDNSWQALSKLMDHEFSALSQACASDVTFCDVKAYHSTTVLGALLLRKGWQLFPAVPSIRNWIIGWWETSLKNAFSVNQKMTKVRLAQKAWISVAKLNARYNH